MNNLNYEIINIKIIKTSENNIINNNYFINILLWNTNIETSDFLVEKFGELLELLFGFRFNGVQTFHRRVYGKNCMSVSPQRQNIKVDLF